VLVRSRTEFLRKKSSKGFLIKAQIFSPLPLAAVASTRKQGSEAKPAVKAGRLVALAPNQSAAGDPEKAERRDRQAPNETERCDVAITPNRAVSATRPPHTAATCIRP